MFDDLPLFSQPPVTPQEAQMQKGMQAAADHAAPDFKLLAEFAVHALAQKKPEFTSNDFWEHLSEFNVHTHENRVAGPVFRYAAKQGWITKTDRTVVSNRKTRNRGDVRVWQSLIFQEVA